MLLSRVTQIVMVASGRILKVINRVKAIAQLFISELRTALSTLPGEPVVRIQQALKI